MHPSLLWSTLILDVAGRWEDPEHNHPTGYIKNWCPVTNIYNIYKKWSRVSLKSPQFRSVPTQFFKTVHKSLCPVHAPRNFQISKGCVLTPSPRTLRFG